jgi:glycosyltransferase involved in cell wall biosynthesis
MTVETPASGVEVPIRIGGRAAIVHDWFQGFHGSERVVAAMLNLFAARPDILTFSATREVLPQELAAAIVAESRLTRLPGIRQRGFDPGRWRLLLPYMPWYFSHLDVRGYDLVISSSHACALGVRPRDDAFHLCYCYTPMRYVWLPEADQRGAGPKQMALSALRNRLRRWDRAAAQRPDAFVAISTAVAERIEAWYGRTATVIHPPVEVQEFDPTRQKEPGHFAWVHRLVPYKRPLEVAEAFRALTDYQLTMVGVGPLEEELRASAPPNVEIRGWISRSDLADLYARVAGFIHVGEEDFGITMVEAQAAGTPVITLDRGGARDIVQDGVNGVTVSDGADVEQLRAAVERVGGSSWDARTLRASAERFAAPVFAAKMRAILDGTPSG